MAKSEEFERSELTLKLATLRRDGVFEKVLVELDKLADGIKALPSPEVMEKDIIAKCTLSEVFEIVEALEKWLEWKARDEYAFLWW